MSRHIRLLPMDSRPVSVLLPEQAAMRAGLAAERPPLRSLGRLKKSADFGTAGQFLMKSLAPAAVIASADYLAYGGLVQSRTSDVSPKSAARNIDILRKFKKKYPDVPLYLFITVPRDAITASDSDSFVSWKKQMRGAAGDNPVRKRNLDLIYDMIRWTGDGVIDFLAIGKEDTAYGNPYGAELKSIDSAINKYCPGKASLAAGADELGTLMTARAAVGLTFQKPRIYFDIDKKHRKSVPTYEPFSLGRTLSAQALAAGAEEVSGPGKADIVIVVHMAGRQEDVFLSQMSSPIPRIKDDDDAAKHTIDRVRKHIDAGRKVGVVDAEHLNGSSGALVEGLLSEKFFFRLISYAGWNTAANSSGNVIADCVSDAAAGVQSNLNISRRLRILTSALCNDYIFSRIARGEAVKRAGDPFNVKHVAEESENIRRKIAAETNKCLKSYLSGLWFDTGVEGQGKARLKKLEVKKVVLPWGRLFETDIRLRADFEVS